MNQRLVQGSQTRSISTKDVQNSHTNLSITGEPDKNNHTTKATSNNIIKQKSTEVLTATNNGKTNATVKNHRNVIENIRTPQRATKTDSESEENTSPRFEMTPNQPAFLRNFTPPDASQGATNVAYEPEREDSPVIVVESSFTRSQPTELPVHHNLIESRQSQIIDAPNGSGTVRVRRENTNLKSFERPHVGALDSVSAISMDEFWKQV